MRVLKQISVTTTEKTSERLGKKYILATAGSTAVLIAFSYKIRESKETDFFTIPANQERKFTAPKGKKIWYIFCKVASGTSTLDLVASEMDINLVSDPDAEVFQQQPDATLNQANPDSGTKYEVLATTKRVRLIGISVQCTWTVQPTPLEIHLTINGQTVTYTFTDPVTATDYFAKNSLGNAETAQELTVTQPDVPFLREGRSVKVEAEITGGTVSNLSARVKYGKIA